MCVGKSAPTSFIKLTVENSVVEHGGRVISCKAETTDLSGGMNILLDEVETGASIHINNVIFYKNSGCTGGNLNIVVSKSKWCASTHNFMNVTIADSLISRGRARVGGGLAFSSTHAHYDN